MLKYSCALLVVADVAVSKRFYEQILGQTITLDIGENVAFEGGFALISKAVYQGVLGDPQQFPILSKPHNMELYLETEDVEGYCRRLEQAGVEFVHKIVEQPWGQLVLRVYDPDGHILEIGETMEKLAARLQSQGMSAEEIAQKTALPLEMIHQFLNPSKS